MKQVRIRKVKTEWEKDVDQALRPMLDWAIFLVVEGVILGAFTAWIWLTT